MAMPSSPARVLIAPDKFAGTLTASEAAQAMGEGWSRARPHDSVDLAPMSDGGPGFLEVMAARLGGRFDEIQVRGPHGSPTTAQLLISGSTAYVESAQACGIHLTHAREAESATTYGVGQLVDAAIRTGATRIVVGVGGSGANDGGAGFLGAMGASGNVPLDRGCVGLRGLTEFELPRRTDIPELVLVTDVDNELTGPRGASFVFGPQKGLASAELQDWDAVLARFARLVAPEHERRPGAGAAGGLGFGMIALGAVRVAGADFVLRALGLPERIAACDVVLTGEGSFDASTAGGKVPAGMASSAARAGRECIVIAGRVGVGRVVAEDLGVTAAYALVDSAGERRAMEDSSAAVTELAESVASGWVRPQAGFHGGDGSRAAHVGGHS